MKATVGFSMLLIVFATIQEPRPRIVIDGSFDDWRDVPVALRDAADPGSPLDLTEIRAVADDRFLFVQVATAREVNVQTIGGLLSLVIDTDANEATGEQVLGLRGADVAIDLGTGGGRQGGVGVRRFPVAPGEPASAPSSVVNLAFAPRFQSNRFEFRVDRTASRRAVIKLAATFAAKVLDDAGPVAIELPALSAGRLPGPNDRVPVDDPLTKRQGTSFRVVVWNVSAFQPAARGRILAILSALDADILLLDETRGRMGATDLESWLPSVASTRPPWRVLLGQSGQNSVIAARGRVESVFDRLPYPAGAFATIPTVASPVDVAKDLADFDDGGVGATGAIVSMADSRVLAVPVDLASGGSPESGPEAMRTLEAQSIRGGVKSAMKTTQARAVLLGGDLNLVGTRTPLDMLVRGLDLDGSDLAVVPALQLDGLSADTWQARGRGGRFPPGRLDWLLFSDSSLALLGSFVFDSTDLNPYWLGQHRLLPTDSTVTSDHRPIVADFRWRR